MKYWLVRVCVGLGCVWGLFGAGCSSSDGGGSVGPVPIEQFPQQFASVLCDSIAPCCTASTFPYVAATCKRNATEEFTNMVTGESSPNIKYDASAAGQCLSRFKDSLKSCVLISDLRSYTPDSPCARIFVGTRPLGAACTPSSLNDCVTGSCQLAPSGVGAVCTPYATDPPGIAEGAPCGASQAGPQYASCLDGLYCNANDVCTKLIPIGGACTSFDVSCAKGAFCAAGVCTAQRDSGPCNGQDSQDACSATTYCSSLSNGFEGQCIKRKPDGYSCTSSDECVTGECNTQCGPAAAASQDTCSGSF